MKLLEENGRKDQAQDLSQLMWYMDGMTRQYEAVLRELQEVRNQLAREKRPDVRSILRNTAAKLENKLHQFKEALDGLWEKISGCAANALKDFREIGVSALDRAVSAMGVKDTLESLREKIVSMTADAKRGIEKAENIGHELRSVGGHLKNAGRTMTGKGIRAVDGGTEGRFQAAVLAPMRASVKLLSEMNNATLAAIGGLEGLEQSAEAVRDHRAEGKSGKKSIRQDLEANRAEIAARGAVSREMEKKPQEAAL